VGACGEQLGAAERKGDVVDDRVVAGVQQLHLPLGQLDSVDLGFGRADEELVAVAAQSERGDLRVAFAHLCHKFKNDSKLTNIINNC